MLLLSSPTIRRANNIHLNSLLAYTPRSCHLHPEMAEQVWGLSTGINCTVFHFPKVKIQKAQDAASIEGRFATTFLLKYEVWVLPEEHSTHGEVER